MTPGQTQEAQNNPPFLKKGIFAMPRGYKHTTRITISPFSSFPPGPVYLYKRYAWFFLLTGVYHNTPIPVRHTFFFISGKPSTGNRSWTFLHLPKYSRLCMGFRLLASIGIWDSGNVFREQEGKSWICSVCVCGDGGFGECWTYVLLQNQRWGMFPIVRLFHDYEN